MIVDASTFNSGGGFSDKSSMHNATGSRTIYGTPTQNSYQDLNDTLCMLSKVLAPDMSVIDAYQGMQNQGPISGLPVDPQQAAIASLDFLSADRIGVELMNFDQSILNLNMDGNDSGFSGWKKYPAYLNYCAQCGVGQYDTSYMDLLGDVTSLSDTNFTKLKSTYAISTATVNGTALWMRPTPLTSPDSIGPDRRLI